MVDQARTLKDFLDEALELSCAKSGACDNCAERFCRKILGCYAHFCRNPLHSTEITLIAERYLAYLSRRHSYQNKKITLPGTIHSVYLIALKMLEDMQSKKEAQLKSQPAIGDVISDTRFRVCTIAATPSPQKLIYLAMHQDYSESQVIETTLSERKCGDIAIERLLKGGRGHFGCLEHPAITFSTAGFPHSVMQQARTHRVGLCLSGDTEVQFGHPSMSSGQTYYKSKISHLANLWFYGRSHNTGEADAKYMQRCISKRNLIQMNENSGRAQFTNITNIYDNGIKPLYKYTIETGSSIKMTREHLVWTPGGWKSAGELQIGDPVFCSTVAGGPTQQNPEIAKEKIEASFSDEEWRPVPGFEWYEVSTLGRIRSWAPRKHRGVRRDPKTPKIKKLSVGSRGYLYASFAAEDAGKSARVNIHTLVLKAFVGSRPEGCVARHLNGNCRDNRLANLEWSTQEENGKDRIEHNVACAKRAISAKIIAIEFAGYEKTYDLEVKGPFRNFLGNGFVVHNSFDVQSMRYTGERVRLARNGQLHAEDVFYLRPIGDYTDRQGKKYRYSKEWRENDLTDLDYAIKNYAGKLDSGFSEEHARGTLPFDFRQNFYVTFTMRSLMHFLDMRSKADAQLEIQQLCVMMMREFFLWAPEIAKWYHETRFAKARLAP
jgi:thymidylate synthase (FAD)